MSQLIELMRGVSTCGVLLLDQWFATYMPMMGKCIVTIATKSLTHSNPIAIITASHV